jgi:hypothetical protein
MRALVMFNLEALYHKCNARMLRRTHTHTFTLQYTLSHTPTRFILRRCNTSKCNSRMSRQRLSGVHTAEEVLRMIGCCVVRGAIVEQKLLGVMEQLPQTPATAERARIL